MLIATSLQQCYNSPKKLHGHTNLFHFWHEADYHDILFIIPRLDSNSPGLDTGTNLKVDTPDELLVQLHLKPFSSLKRSGWTTYLVGPTHPYCKDLIVTREVVADDGVHQPRNCGAWLRRCTMRITF